MLAPSRSQVSGNAVGSVLGKLELSLAIFVLLSQNVGNMIDRPDSGDSHIDEQTKKLDIQSNVDAMVNNILETMANSTRYSMHVQVQNPNPHEAVVLFRAVKKEVEKERPDLRVHAQTWPIRNKTAKEIKYEFVMEVTRRDL